MSIVGDNNSFKVDNSNNKDNQMSIKSEQSVNNNIHINNKSNESNDSHVSLNKKKKQFEIDSARDNLHNNSNNSNNKEHHSAINKVYTHKSTLSRMYSLKESDNENNSIINEVKKSIWRKKIKKFVDSTPVLIVMSVCTLFVLFITDIQAAFLRKNVDYGLNVIQCTLLVLFAIEIILACIGKPEYVLSFFFWLDLIATISMIEDIDWIMEPIMGYQPHDPSITIDASAHKGKSAARRAVNTVNSATRATRVLRIIRIVRLIRMVKLYKSVVIAKEKKEKRKMEELKERLKNEKEVSENSSSSREKSSEESLRQTTATVSNTKDNNNTSQDINNHNNGVHDNYDDNKDNDDEIHKDDNDNEDIDVPEFQTIEHNDDNDICHVNMNYKRRKSNISNLYSENIPITTKTSMLKDKIKRVNTIKKVATIKKAVTIRSIKSLKHKRTNEEEINYDMIFENISDDEDEEELINETHISRIVTESLTKKVIILILGLLIIFPFLSDDFYTDTHDISYSQLAEYLTNDEILYGVYSYIIPKDTLDLFFDKDFPAINISIGKTLYYTNPEYTDVNYFRYNEISSEYSEDGTVCVVYSLLTETKLEGILNMAQTLFVCVCLAVATILFENDANKLVLTPLEIMTEIVETVAKDPVNARNVEALQTGIKAVMNQEEQNVNDNNNNNNNNNNINNSQSTIKYNNNDHENYEISVIKTAIVKISALLAISFGEAGGHIIAKNLSNDQELIPRFRGKKKNAIFGFCDIRQFDKITIALEERISLFVNNIAEIVHSSVDRFGGATNKNIGDAFLNVWKFYNETPIKKTKLSTIKRQSLQRKDNLIEIDPSNIQVSITADSSILAFLRILMKINKSFSLLSYRDNPSILKHIPNFKLNMGFGLHFGYGIEGAIGSSYKIDASYLSPNVNIAARLESATKQFGVNLLISDTLYDKCSSDMKKICRYIDCVKVKGSELPLKLYTIDVNLDLKVGDMKKVKYASIREKRRRFAEKKELFKKEIDYEKSVAKVVLAKSSYMELLKTKRNDEFYSLWNNGIDNYKEGNFKKASEYFNKCLLIEPNDGPAKTLINYFEKVKYVKPEEWKGVRELFSK